MKVTMLMALTLDGKIGKTPDHFPDWTGKADKRLFVEMTKKVGVVVMGSKTFDTIGKPLPERKTIVMTRDNTRRSDWDNLEFTNEKPGEILNRLEKEGYSEIILAGGALVNSLFAEEKLIHEIVVTISPIIFGHGISLFTPEISMDLELLEIKKMEGNLVFLRYHVIP